MLWPVPWSMLDGSKRAASGPSGSVGYMGTHMCIYADGYKIPCVCDRGIDHKQEEFDVPLSDPEVDAAIEAALNDPAAQPYSRPAPQPEEDLQPSTFIDASKYQQPEGES